MNVAKRFAHPFVSFLPIFVSVILWSLPLWSQALPGDNAVYNTGGAVTYSHAFIDASQLGAGDICANINLALKQLSNTMQGGALVYNLQGLVDARGVPTANYLNCSMNPWVLPAPTNGWPAAIILLPAGTITTPATWTLPAYTRLTGEGSGLTILSAGSGLTGEIISMGQSSSHYCPNVMNGPDCVGVVIEHLELNANGSPNVIGIANYYSQELSRVNDVSIVGIGNGGVGLDLSAFGDNSGPYTNIYVSGNSNTVNEGCARITGASNTDSRGIHGLTCNTTGMVCNSGSNSASICLDASSTTIEDVTFTGSSTDGILVGSMLAAQGNVLLNISGSNGQTNVIELSNNQTGNGDITILGATGPGGSVNTIKDDLTSTNLTDATVGLYIVGEPMFTGAYSRFTTSTSLPTWLIGQNQPAGSCAVGDLYSATSAGSFWGCINPPPKTPQWVPIPTH
jgi:hypothetical protein